MNWEKFLGSKIYSLLKEYCEYHKMTLASAVRSAVFEFISNKGSK